MKRTSTPQTKAFTLKGGLYTFTTLHLKDTDLVAINTQLSETVAQAPKFFDHTPIVIDLQALSQENEIVDITLLANCLREHRLIPIGVRGGHPQQREMAQQAGWALLPETQKSSEATTEKSSKTAKNTKTAATPPAGIAGKVITQQVRSGQQIYAQGGDLIVLAPVSAGAEILADGHIHVYAPLRGRALAGVQGNTQARIFCQHLEAELIAIAGHYKVCEQLRDQVSAWEKSALIYLTDEHLTIQSLHD